jgi:hypothetical protein
MYKTVRTVAFLFYCVSTVAAINCLHCCKCTRFLYCVSTVAATNCLDCCSYIRFLYCVSTVAAINCLHCCKCTRFLYCVSTVAAAKKSVSTERWWTIAISCAFNIVSQLFLPAHLPIYAMYGERKQIRKQT